MNESIDTCTYFFLFGFHRPLLSKGAKRCLVSALSLHIVAILTTFMGFVNRKKQKWAFLRRLWGTLFTARKTASGKMRGNMVYLAQRRDAPVLVYMSLMDSTDDRTKFERVYQNSSVPFPRRGCISVISIEAVLNIPLYIY